MVTRIICVIKALLYKTELMTGYFETVDTKNTKQHTKSLEFSNEFESAKAAVQGIMISL